MAQDLSIYQLFGQENNVDEIPPLVERYLEGSDQNSVRGFFLMSAFDLFDIIKKINDTEYEIKIKSETKSVLSVELERSIERSNKKIIGSLILVKTSQLNIYFTLSNADLEFINLGMKRFFETFYPKISLVRFSSKDIFEALNVFESSSKLSIIADKTVAHKRIYKSKRESSVTYTSIPYNEAFRRSNEENSWIDKIDFSASKLDNEIETVLFKGFLSRESIFRVDKNFTLFYTILIEKLSERARSLFLLYNERGRLKNNETQPAKPLEIEYGYPILDQPKKNKQLVDAMKELANSSISIIHGNPYLHASVLDFLDGSTYDLWVLSQNKIIIVPQLRATCASVNRICSHILRRFGEGRIKEFEADVNDARN